GVVHRDVADDEICLKDQLEHVGADVAGVFHLSGGAAGQAAARQRRIDQARVHAVEIDGSALRICLGTEAADDEDALHGQFTLWVTFYVLGSIHKARRTWRSALPTSFIAAE